MTSYMTTRAPPATNAPALQPVSSECVDGELICPEILKYCLGHYNSYFLCVQDNIMVARSAKFITSASWDVRQCKDVVLDFTGTGKEIFVIGPVRLNVGEKGRRSLKKQVKPS